MTAIEKKPRIAGVAGTIAFWAAVLLLSTIFSFFARKPVYKTVQIRLDSPQTQTQQARAAAAPKAAESVAQAAPSAPPPPPAPAQTANKPAPQTATQPPLSKSNAGKAKNKSSDRPKELPLVEDTMEAFNKKVENRKPSEKKINWDEIKANTSENQQNLPSNKSQPEVQALSDESVGLAADKQVLGRASSNDGERKNEVSPDTLKNLSDIALTSKTYPNDSGNGVFSTVTAETGNAADGTAIKMADGVTTRTLWNPKKPEIDLTDVSSLIDNDKNLQIQFSITPAGDVSLSSITILPAASVPEAVRRKIESQISTWKFTKADTTNTALLPYTITIKK